MSGRGEELARWLEGLGLVEQLGAAGLPRLERDAEGRARWSDPGTGEPLSEGQLTQLAELLHREGSEPEHAVPVAMVRLAHEARTRRLLRATAGYDYAGLATLRGASVEATRFAVHRAAAEHRLLVVPVDEGVVVPAFQLDGTGGPRHDLAPVLAPLLAARMDPWRVWAWLTQPAALLGGQVPERAVAGPDAELVVRAAGRLAARVAGG